MSFFQPTLFRETAQKFSHSRCKLRCGNGLRKNPSVRRVQVSRHRAAASNSFSTRRFLRSLAPPAAPQGSGFRFILGEIRTEIFIANPLGAAPFLKNFFAIFSRTFASEAHSRREIFSPRRTRVDRNVFMSTLGRSGTQWGKVADVTHGCLSTVVRR